MYLPASAEANEPEAEVSTGEPTTMEPAVRMTPSGTAPKERTFMMDCPRNEQPWNKIEKTTHRWTAAQRLAPKDRMVYERNIDGAFLTPPSGSLTTISA